MLYPNFQTLENQRKSFQQLEFEKDGYTVYHWNHLLKLLCTTDKYELDNVTECYTKGCSWSPDGTCLLVSFSDYKINIYNLPAEVYACQTAEIYSSSGFKPALSIKEGGLIYDICWYPCMNLCSSTCYFLTTSKETPIHLWDASTGDLRATYRAYNQMDEVDAAMSAQFTNDGHTIWTGYKGAIRSFDTNRPGRQVNDVVFNSNFAAMHGIVSCIRDNPTSPGLLAIGTYSKCIGLYKDGPLCLFETDSGVSQVEFSPCGTKLYSAVRRSNEFLCWDLRNPGTILYSLTNRQSDTNQKIQFCLSNNGNQIMSGGTDGIVKIWKILEPIHSIITPTWNILLSENCINGVNTHQNLPIFASSSGQRTCNRKKISDDDVCIWNYSNLLSKP